MELTTMFLQQLSGGAKNNIKLSTSKSGNDFNNFMSKAENKAKISDKKQDIKKYEKPEVKKNDNYDKKSNDKVEDKKEINKLEKEDDEKIIVADKEKINEIANLLGIDADKVIDVLSQLSMSISMLQEPENMMKFLQTALDVKNPVELLAMNNIKDIMSSLKNIAKSIDYKDIMSFKEFGEFLQNAKSDINILNSDNKGLKEKIDGLLEELNGKVEEVSEAMPTIKVDYVKLKEANTTTAEELFEHQAENKVEEIQNAPKQEQSAFEFSQNSENFMQNSGEEARAEIEIQNDTFSINNLSTSNNTKVFNATLPKTQVLRNINQTDVVNQIMETMKTSIKPGVSEVKIILKPEELGDISLKIATQNGVVTAQFTAESQRVKEIIEANFNQLRDMLSEQGVNIGALEVNVSSDGEGQNQEFNMFEDTNKKIERILDEVSNEKQETKENIEILDSSISYSI